MALRNQRAMQEDLYQQLVEASDSEFRAVRDAFDKHMVGFVYGRETNELLTGDLLRAVEHQRSAKAASIAVGRADNMYRPDYNYTAEPNIRDAYDAMRRKRDELEGKNTHLEQELSDLRRRFETLFRVPAVGMRTTIDQPPENPEQWRVRIHVPAFTVETTMGALTAAKGSLSVAMTWGQSLSAASIALSHALENAKIHIATHIVTGEHSIESAEPNTSIEPDFK